jgi:oxygen-independent coproporphyrinogen-3 oxidase
VRADIDHEAWLKAYLHELDYWHEKMPHYTISSIFFGGGTPSLMPPELVTKMLEHISQRWRIDADIEITLEANPTSIEAEKFAALKAAGINRVSLGIQSLDNAALQFLGREHSVDEALAALAIAQQHFTRVSFDLIYALPNQTLGEWELQLQRAIGFGTSHLSLYQLTIEENTAFHHAYHQAKKFTLPDENLGADLYELTQNCTQAAGLPAYEISNHARSGQASKHNLTYWRTRPYLGIGPGAHGRVMQDGTRYATQNIRSPNRWLSRMQTQAHALENITALSPMQMLEERVLMGLRLLDEGVVLPSEIMQKIQPDLAILKTHGLIDPLAENIRLTPKGALLTNQVVLSICEALQKTSN